MLYLYSTGSRMVPLREAMSILARKQYFCASVVPIWWYNEYESISNGSMTTADACEIGTTIQYSQ